MAKSASITKAEPVVLALACLLPTAVTYAYFYLVADAPPAVQQAVYAVGKTVQFGLPVVWVGAVLRHRLSGVRLTTRGLAMGLGFGAVVCVASLLAYVLWLQDLPLIATAAAPIRAKVDDLGIGTPAVYLAVSVFYALCHSLLEEYYWRWFVFRRLRRWVAFPQAVAVSSVGFMAHHILVLNRYFPETPLATAALSLSVMIGGVFWAWLYERSRSLLGPWISHLLVDAAIFAIGYLIVFST